MNFFQKDETFPLFEIQVSDLILILMTIVKSILYFCTIRIITLSIYLKHNHIKDRQVTRKTMGNCTSCYNSKQKNIPIGDQSKHEPERVNKQKNQKLNNPQDNPKDSKHEQNVPKQDIQRQDNGDLYEGQVLQKQRNGKGTLFYNNGKRFEGFWINGKKDRGAIIELDGTRTLEKYIYQADNPSRVTIIRSNGEKFEGTLINDRREGFGTSKYSNGDKFEGEFRDDFRNGKGIYIKKYGTKLEGDWVNDRKTKIIRTDQKGNQSTQYWVYDDKIAKMQSSTGDKYEGSMKNDKMQGKGKYTWGDGQIYEGQFHNDLRQGKGWYYWPDGDKLYGQFKLHNLDGKAIFYRKDGSIEQRIYKKGVICERVKQD